jgi:hypothetical protein
MKFREKIAHKETLSHTAIEVKSKNTQDFQKEIIKG